MAGDAGRAPTARLGTWQALRMPWRSRFLECRHLYSFSLCYACIHMPAGHGYACACARVRLHAYGKQASDMYQCARACGCALRYIAAYACVCTPTSAEQAATAERDGAQAAAPADDGSLVAELRARIAQLEQELHVHMIHMH